MTQEAAIADSHAHLDHVAERLGADFVDTMLLRFARASSFIVDVGTIAGDVGQRHIRYESFVASGVVRLTAGIWPGEEALEAVDTAIDALKKDLDKYPCAAVGECGLDYYHRAGSRERQIELFERQAMLASERKLPLVVHSRDAFSDTRAVLEGLRMTTPVIIHCFSYDASAAKSFLDLGCYISFAGNLSYRNARALREALLVVPGERLLLETDSPYLRPEPHRGSPSSSLDLGLTLAAAANLYGVSPESLGEIIDRNSALLFSRKTKAESFD